MGLVPKGRQSSGGDVGGGGWPQYSEMTFLKWRKPECFPNQQEWDFPKLLLNAPDAQPVGRSLPQLLRFCDVAHPRTILFSCIYRVITGPC